MNESMTKRVESDLKWLTATVNARHVDYRAALNGCGDVLEASHDLSEKINEFTGYAGAVSVLADISYHLSRTDEKSPFKLIKLIEGREVIVYE